MAKTNSDLIRELNQEVTTQKGQIDRLRDDIQEIIDLRVQIVRIDKDLTRFVEQVEEVRRKQIEADTRWKWLIATFIGLLISMVVALLTVLLRR